MFFQVAQGFEYLRKHNIMHRDLKPANILIHKGQYKIADFGLAKLENLGSSVMYLYLYKLGASLSWVRLCICLLRSYPATSTPTNVMYGALVSSSMNCCSGTYPGRRLIQITCFLKLWKHHAPMQTRSARSPKLAG
jgi:serine/threonine protein kinase